MREIFTSGTVGGALGNQCFYPEMQTFQMTELISYISLLNTLDTFPLKNDLIQKIMVSREGPRIITSNFKKYYNVV